MKKYFAKLSKPGQSRVKTLLDFCMFLFTREGFKLLKKVVKKILIRLGLWKDPNPGYDKWIAAKQQPAMLRKYFDASQHLLVSRPLISIVVPVYNPPLPFLKQAIESVISQSYSNWQLCLSDDCSPDPGVRSLMREYARKDKRIQVVFREQNGHISANTNSALQLATGGFVLFMDHDDLLTPDCLFEIALHTNLHPQDDIIYTDEDKVDEAGKYSFPHFKPDWAPDNLLSRNYMGHVVVIRKELVDKVGGLREGFEGSQDHDLLLRTTELTRHIGHIPKVLYHWRIHRASVAGDTGAKPYAYDAAKRALEDAMMRRGTPAVVEDIPGILGGYRIRYQPGRFPKVTVIIPTRDQVKLLRAALDSIFDKTEYPDYEVILLDNNSTSQEFNELVHHFDVAQPNRFRCIPAHFPFNFARLMNLGVQHSSGELLLFCNNDIVVIQADWMAVMASFATRSHTGAVGVKLLYPDNTIQHAGVVLGLGGAAGHVFVNMGRKDRGYFNYVQSLNNYAAVTAACMMCRKTAYEEVGGMDEELEVEYNDVDLCLKFLDRGYYNVYVPDVEVYHYESATRGHPYQSKESWAQHEHDFGIFRKKWQRWIDNDPFYNPNLSVHCTDFQLKPLGS